MRKPFQRKGRPSWFIVNSEGKEVSLGTNEEEAFAKWEYMKANAAEVTSLVPFSRLLKEWKDKVTSGKAEEERAIKVAEELSLELGNKPVMAVTPREIYDWLNDDKPGQMRADGTCSTRKWSQSTKRQYLAQIKKITKWGNQTGILPTDPFASITLAEADPRDEVMTPEQLELIRENTDDSFFQFIQACYLSGCRQQQVRDVTAKHVSPCGTRWVFPKHKTKGKTGKPLVVYLPKELQEITKHLMKLHPRGPLFRNGRGQPWLINTVCQRFRRLRRRLGLPETLTMHCSRHAFATESLVDGTRLEVVAELLGHKDTRQVSRVYGHLDKAKDHLLKSVERRSSSSEASSDEESDEHPQSEEA